MSSLQEVCNFILIRVCIQKHDIESFTVKLKPTFIIVKPNLSQEETLKKKTWHAILLVMQGVLLNFTENCMKMKERHVSLVPPWILQCIGTFLQRVILKNDCSSERSDSSDEKSLLFLIFKAAIWSVYFSPWSQRTLSPFTLESYSTSILQVHVYISGRSRSGFSRRGAPTYFGHLS